MSLEQIFKSKGKDSYCMYLRVKKSSLQSEIQAIEKQIEPLRSIRGLKGYDYTYTKEEKNLLDSTNLKLTNMYQELKNYETKLSQNDCVSTEKKVKSCKLTDEYIKRKKDLISELAKGVVAGRSNPSDLQQLNKELLSQENIFTENDCRNLLENERLAESGLILTEKSAIQESSVLKGNYKEQYIYIGLGAVVLLTGLYIVTKK
jgi:hypothetical protein